MHRKAIAALASWPPGPSQAAVQAAAAELARGGGNAALIEARRVAAGDDVTLVNIEQWAALLDWDATRMHHLRGASKKFLAEVETLGENAHYDEFVVAQRLRGIVAKTPLNEARRTLLRRFVPEQDKYLDDAGPEPRYPRWHPKTVVEWAIACGRLNGTTWEKIDPPMPTRRGAPDKELRPQAQRHVKLRDAVVAEYKQRVIDGYDNSAAFEWAADKVGVNIDRAKKYVYEARKLPEYGGIPEGPATSKRRRRAVDLYRQHKTGKTSKTAALQMVAEELRSPVSGIVRLLTEAANDPERYGDAKLGDFRPRQRGKVGAAAP